MNSGVSRISRGSTPGFDMPSALGKIIVHSRHNSLIFILIFFTLRKVIRLLSFFYGLPSTATCMSTYDNDNFNNSRSGADMGGGGGLRGTPVVPLPPPVPPSPLEPSAVQRVDSPSGGRVHRGGDLLLSSSPPFPPSPPPPPPLPSLPPDVNPLPGCSDPDFCVGGLDHLSFKAPGGIDPTRDQIVWVTQR